MEFIRKHPKRKPWFLIQGLCSIIDGLIRIVFLGFCYSSIEYQFIKWELFRKVNKK